MAQPIEENEKKTQKNNEDNKSKLKNIVMEITMKWRGNFTLQWKGVNEKQERDNV